MDENIFINVSSKCFLHETVHSIWEPRRGWKDARKGKREGYLCFRFLNIISDFIQGKREDEDGDEELMSEGACLSG